MKMNELNRQLKKASVITKVLNSSNDPDRNLDLNKTAMLFKFHEYYKYSFRDLRFGDAYDMVHAIGKLGEYDLEEYIGMLSAHQVKIPSPGDFSLNDRGILPEMLLFFTNRTAREWLSNEHSFTHDHFINQFVILDPRVVSWSYIYGEDGDFYHLRDEEWIELFTDNGIFYISKEDYTDIMDRGNDWSRELVDEYNEQEGKVEGSSLTEHHVPIGQVQS